MEGYSINELSVGQSESIQHIITDEAIRKFGEATGDFNPVHFDEEYASKTFFKTRIAHGLISVCYLSTLMANTIPGPGSIYLGQTAEFLAPVRLGETITCTVTIREIHEDKKYVVLDTVATNEAGVVVVKGEAKVMPPRKRKTVE